MNRVKCTSFVDETTERRFNNRLNIARAHAALKTFRKNLFTQIDFVHSIYCLNELTWVASNEKSTPALIYDYAKTT